MKYVTPKQSKALSVLALAALVSSCSLKSNGPSQMLTIALPGASFVQNPILKSMTEWMSLAWAGSSTTAFNLNNDPANLSEFDCFAVNVNGPGINLDPNVTCTDPGDSPAIIGGFVNAGNASIDVMVPAGPDRTIRILGVKSLIGCPNFRDMVTNGGIDFKSIGHFYEIGRARQDIFSDANVTIKATYSSTSATRAFSQCKANGDNSGSHVWGVYAASGPGQVNASKTVNGISYITGKFDYAGPNTHSGVMISQATGLIAGSNIANINGTVNCAAPDGFGGYYVGGSFSQVNSTPLSNAGVIHIQGDGSWDPNFFITLNTGTVNTCLRDGIHLYLGGTFSQLTFNSGPNSIAAALADVNLVSNTATNLGLVAAFGGSPTVNSISLGSGRLYVGGEFTFNSSGTHFNAVAINISTTPALDASWLPDPTIGGTGGSVKSLFHDGASNVYLGGSFTRLGDGSNRNHLARVSDSTGATDSGWDPSTTLAGAMNVNSILSDGSSIYAAVVDSTDQKVVQLDPTAGTLLNPVFTTSTAGETINTIALSTTLSGPVLYVGGNFKTTTGSKQQGLIAYNNLSTTPTRISDSAFSANTNAGRSVNAIVPNAAGRLFVGGDFDSIGGALRDNMAAINLASGTATSWNPTGFSRGEGKSIASDGSSIYVGYKSDSIHSILGGVAQISTGASATLLHSAAVSTLSENVYTIALSPDNSYLYVGGQFANLGSGSSLGNLARLSTTNLSYDSSWTSFISTGTVNKILVKNDVVYVGGSFTHAGPTSASTITHPSLVAFHTGDSNAVSGFVNADLSVGVDSMTFLPSGDLAVATQFMAGSGPALIKKIKSTDGSTLQWATGQNDLALTMQQAKTMITAGGALYVGGLAGNLSNPSLVAFNLIDDQPISGFDPRFFDAYSGGASTSVNSLESPVSGQLLVGGVFSQANVDGAGNGGYEAWGLGVINANTGTYY